MALASLGIDVRSFELDEVTAAVATYNLAAFENVRVEIADVEQLDVSQFEALFFDPARRELHGPKKATTQRHFDPANYSPNYNFCIEKAKTKPSGIKLGPGHDKKQIPEGTEAQWVSVDGDLVEMSLWFGKVARNNVARSALLIKGELKVEINSKDSTSGSAELAQLGKYVYEPDNSLIRSGLIADFAEPEGLTLIAPDIAYLSSDTRINSPWLKGYEVIDDLVFDRKKLKAYVRENDIGILEIKKRGSDISPEVLRKQLAPKGAGAATLIVTRVGDAHRVLVTQPISD
jgi:hypothetical protein